MVVARYTEDFKVEWSDEADGASTWTADPMHFPRPFPPLSGEITAGVIESVFNARVALVNGYAYMMNYAPPPPPPEVMQLGATTVWETQYLPRIREVCARLRSTDYDSLSDSDLVKTLDDYIRQGTEAFRYTMLVVFGFMIPTMQLMDFCEAELGPEAGTLVASLLQGYENETASAGAGLANLAELAASTPAVADALRAGRFDDLASVPGGAEFTAELQRYLDEYGWRVESWGLAHQPTWAEDPRVPLSLIARYIAHPDRSPAKAIERAVRQREEAEREIESRLGGEKLEQFRSALQAARAHVPMSEGRAMWQLIIIGSLRVVFLGVGKRLAGAGVIDEPADVFFMTTPEIRDAVTNRRPMQEVVKGRKADLARQERLNPPPFLGPAPTVEGMPPQMRAASTRFYGLGVQPSSIANVVNGHAASKGVVRGVARIVRDLTESDRLGAGEILVCPTTAAPWTPLFSIAGGVVTDTGGILSHSAICAREYAIPCVVGTQIATIRIPDGAVITVDGDKGTVTIEG